MALLRLQAGFVREHPKLSEVMFSRPFADFDPGPAELKAGNAVRKAIVGRVRRCIEAKVMTGNETDIAHVLLAMLQGLIMQERAGWLGTSQASIERRWELGLQAAIAGLRPTDWSG
ncbi:MAG: TetR-like C-terminal domain-containing protein [Myxococcales bacterium]